MTMVVIDPHDEGKQSDAEAPAHEGAGLKSGPVSSRLPDWFPTYPGTSPQGTFSAQTQERSQSTFSFKTKDAPPKVIAYYQDQLKAGGFSISLTATSPEGGVLMAEDASKSRTAMLTASGAGDETAVSASLSERKPHPKE